MGKIQTALISVSDKNRLTELASSLHAAGVRLISTGGTARQLREAGLPVDDASAVTGFPEVMDGRVKTLHPAIHAGILARRDVPADMATLAAKGFVPIDLVVVNLYPFVETVARGVSLDQALEEIDVGGPTMVRAAAKNFPHVAVVTDPDDYPVVVEEMTRLGGELSPVLRLRLAQKAFRLTARYDAHIGAYLAGAVVREEKVVVPETTGTLPSALPLVLRRERPLRYGENPHQQGALYVDADRPLAGLAAWVQLHGKELSYNNYLDMDAAWRLISEFEDCACVIVKHNNPCGAALGDTPVQAYTRALATDPDSSFGSIIAFNRPVDAAGAEELSKLFVEVVCAPDYEEAALAVLTRKKNIRVMRLPKDPPIRAALSVRSLVGAFLVQEEDSNPITDGGWRVVSRKQPSPREKTDLLFAWRCVRQVRSNAIVLAKDGQLVGVGAGQMSRVDSAKIAVAKSRQSLDGAVMASDAFLPFRDTLDIVAEAGITALAATGGSVRDEEVIAAANEWGVALVFTGVRHFRH